jgi:uncharacterized membrane protein AbrB (regulator of aidB expression)
MASDRLQQTGRIAFALGLGAVGGWAFWALNMPLPWMLGALFATMAAAVAGCRWRARRGSGGRWSR